MGRYGKPLIGVVVVGLLAFAAYLYWDNRQESSLESSSEELVTALDQLQAGNVDAASSQVAGFEGQGTPAISAKMLRAGIAAEGGNAAEAATLFGEIADDESAPEVMRNLALIRRTALRFDQMEPAEVIAAMKPLAVPGEPFFASAGELVAHAYLEQDKRSEAGALFAEIARDENTPEPARARMLNMAGILGVDAVDDVQDILDTQSVGSEGAEIVSE
ncbi:tetratricopeptide repeat protein [Erythrobacter vulgaris]|uniref:Tetratricopeptide repeat protein n=2 Tax=Qipengyuania vulgaris TaxID=291985 RepID=A0A844XRP9_9SPHN|nr:tetratricopeptide repeat protein [Qipengyuania vulgaris]MXO47698.1 tetratricopeptide repeat protein [Qipengyuania vulgaris]